MKTISDAFGIFDNRLIRSWHTQPHIYSQTHTHIFTINIHRCHCHIILL